MRGLASLAAAGNVATRIDAIFSGFSDDERAWLFRRTAERWYAPAAADDA
jgi:hypothetical protein